MTEEQRAAWNAAVAACDTDPTPANLERRDTLKREILTGIYSRELAEIMPWQYGPRRASAAG